MKHLIKVFAFLMFFSSAMGFAQGAEDVKKEVEKKAEKVYKTDDDKRVYDTSKKHLATKATAEQKLAAMDADKDGKVSIDEVSASGNNKLSENFDHIDTNNDGYIDLTELKAKMAKSKDKNKMKKKVDY